MSDWTKYLDVIPANARVIVDYTKPPKDRVMFSYPREWTYNKAVWKENLPTFYTIWWLLVITFVGVPILIMEYCKRQSIELSMLSHPAFMKEELIWIFSITGLILLIPLLINFILSRNPVIYGKLIPRLNFFMARSSMKYIMFEPKDVNDNKTVIPIFSNVYLDYKATEDFDKYLEKVEVLELPFSYWKGTKKGKPKLEKNDYKFRAVFYFKDKPKTGNLEVKFI